MLKRKKNEKNSQEYLQEVTIQHILGKVDDLHWRANFLNSIGAFIRVVKSYRRVNR